MPETRAPGTSSIQQPPNILVRAIARWGVSIRSKLLIAFLGIAVSMAGLALFDLSALQQANARTEQLLQDQARVAVYTELNSAMGILTMMTIAPADYEQDKSGTAKSTWLIAPAASLNSRMADLKYLLGQSIRRFGGPESLDGKRLIELRSGLSKLSPMIGRIAELRRSDNLIAIKTMVYAEFAPIALGLQRDTYTIKRQIEDEMARRARLTAIAYETSRHRVIAAALITIGGALLLAYAISSSVIWPVRRIMQTLDTVALGGVKPVRWFQTRMNSGNLP